MDESILGFHPTQEAVDAILKEIHDAVPKVTEEGLNETCNRRLTMEYAGYDESVA
jgi:hypothetical protein